jgi:DNA-binding FadR family transcriptional regulator
MRANAHADYVDITQALTAHDPVRARIAMVHHLIHVQDSAVPSRVDEQPAEAAQP